jgi:hypothetical protein
VNIDTFGPYLYVSEAASHQQRHSTIDLSHEKTWGTQAFRRARVVGRARESVSKVGQGREYVSIFGMAIISFSY